MIGHCFDPVCKKELRYLRQGSVYQLGTGSGRTFHSEFFWLCSDCSSTFQLTSNDTGVPLLAPQGGHAAEDFTDQTRTTREAGCLASCPPRLISSPIGLLNLVRALGVRLQAIV